MFCKFGIFEAPFLMRLEVGLWIRESDWPQSFIPVSAGFFCTNNGTATAYGSSVSLDLKSSLQDSVNLSRIVRTYGLNFDGSLKFVRFTDDSYGIAMQEGRISHQCLRYVERFKGVGSFKYLGGKIEEIRYDEAKPGLEVIERMSLALLANKPISIYTDEI